MFIANRPATLWSQNVESVHFYRNIVFIHKGDNSGYRVHDYAKQLMRREVDALEAASVTGSTPT
jgi:hypothetical protein